MSNYAATAVYSAARMLERFTANMQRALPQHCALCSARSGTDEVCRACDRAMPRPGLACPCCALPTSQGEICGHCLRHPPPFEATRVAFNYAFPLDRLVQRMKYGGQLACIDYLADPLAAAVTCWPDMLLAVPLAPARQRMRGFNQSHELATRVARRHRVPIGGGLVRARDTPPQATLPWAQRVRNVRGAFRADASVTGLRVAIVDDVMTTGATLAAAATAVRRAGARSVEAWVVARTLPPAQQP
jgi:ComF family protein